MPMVYSVKEMYLTVQGEGAQTGRPAVFLRFAGCNLWNGLESGRASAVCKFCDTDFIGTDGPGGGKFVEPEDLSQAVLAPQLNPALIAALKIAGFKIAVETNGTVAAPRGLDWICVSPKADADLVQTSGHELKLVYPQKENAPSDFEALEFTRFSLQPLDDAHQADNAQAAFQFCLKNPKWTLSLQTHKWINVP